MDDSRPLCIHNDEARKTRKGEAAPRWLVTPLPHPIFPPIPSEVYPSILDNVHSWDQIDLASYDTFGLIGIAETRQFSRIKYTYFQVRAISKYILLTCVQQCCNLFRALLSICNATYTIWIFYFYFLPYIIGWNKTHTIHGYCFMRHAAFVKSLQFIRVEVGFSLF